MGKGIRALVGLSILSTVVSAQEAPRASVQGLYEQCIAKDANSQTSCAGYISSAVEMMTASCRFNA